MLAIVVRIGVVYPQLRKMTPDAVQALQHQAMFYRENLDIL
jgi:deoxyribodipyrimidine photolyase-like uncharacterized protein